MCGEMAICIVASIITKLLKKKDILNKVYNLYYHSIKFSRVKKKISTAGNGNFHV